MNRLPGSPQLIAKAETGAVTPALRGSAISGNAASGNSRRVIIPDLLSRNNLRRSKRSRRDLLHTFRSIWHRLRHLAMVLGFTL